MRSLRVSVSNIQYTSAYPIAITDLQKAACSLREAPALPRLRQKRAMEKSVRSPNRFLASLSSADYELLRPHLKTIELVHAMVLFEAGDPIKHVYFPHSGIISLIVGLKGGQTIEVAMIGCDSVVGGSFALGASFVLNKGIVRAPGIASILDATRLRKAAAASSALRKTLFRHEQATLAQAQQSVACNAKHSIEARLARWLLRSRDLFVGNTVPLTQAILGQILGVQRTGVSVAANTLQEAGLIKYARGRIQISGLKGLKRAACECYGTAKANSDRLLNGS
jgi:CRP-like cAMP-binding protein